MAKNLLLPPSSSKVQVQHQYASLAFNNNNNRYNDDEDDDEDQFCIKLNDYHHQQQQHQQDGVDSDDDGYYQQHYNNGYQQQDSTTTTCLQLKMNKIRQIDEQLSSERTNQNELDELFYPCESGEQLVNESGKQQEKNNNLSVYSDEYFSSHTTRQQLNNEDEDEDEEESNSSSMSEVALTHTKIEFIDMNNFKMSCLHFTDSLSTLAESLPVTPSSSSSSLKSMLSLPPPPPPPPASQILQQAINVSAQKPIALKYAAAGTTIEEVKLLPPGQTNFNDAKPKLLMPFLHTTEFQREIKKPRNLDLNALETKTNLAKSNQQVLMTSPTTTIVKRLEKEEVSPTDEAVVQKKSSLEYCDVKSKILKFETLVRKSLNMTAGQQQQQQHNHRLDSGDFSGNGNKQQPAKVKELKNMFNIVRTNH